MKRLLSADSGDIAHANRLAAVEKGCILPAPVACVSTRPARAFASPPCGTH